MAKTKPVASTATKAVSEIERFFSFLTSSDWTTLCASFALTATASFELSAILGFSNFNSAAHAILRISLRWFSAKQRSSSVTAAFDFWRAIESAKYSSIQDSQSARWWWISSAKSCFNSSKQSAGKSFEISSQFLILLFIWAPRSFPI